MRSFIIVCVTVMLLCPAVTYGGSPVFGVRPGMGIHGSYFGLASTRWTFYGGLDLLAIGVSVKGSDTDWRHGYSSNQMYKHHEGEYDMSGSATLLIPRVGAKFFISGSASDLRPYLIGDFFKTFAFVNVDGKEVDRYYSESGQMTGFYVDEFELDENDEDMIESILSVWGINLGFGVEYQFSEHFSVGGEYGLRWFKTSADQQDESSSSWDGQEQFRENWSDELSASLKMSYATAVLSFYFD